MRTLGSGGRSGTVICTGMTLVTGRKRERDPAAAAAKAPRACGQLASEVAVFTALLEPGEERLQPLSAATGSERSFTLDSAFLHSGLARAAWCTLGSRGWSLAWRCLFEGFQKKKKKAPPESRQKSQLSGMVVSGSCQKVFVEKEVQHNPAHLFSLSRCKTTTTTKHFQLKREGIESPP